MESSKFWPATGVGLPAGGKYLGKVSGKIEPGKANRKGIERYRKNVT